MPTYRHSHSKYHNVPTGPHASRKEHRRAALLNAMQSSGIISNLREQVSFELIPSQYATCGTDLKGHPVKKCIERACRYVADFVYTDNQTGQTIVEDTKGIRTKEYIIKRKLMLYLHGIRIKEV